MVDWFRCNDCKKAFPLLGNAEAKCSSCGGSRGEVVSQEHIREGTQAGAYFNIDPRTGKPSRKKPR
jgi:hypothetical protein